MFASHTSVYFCCHTRCCEGRVEDSHTKAKELTSRLFKAHGDPEQYVYDQIWQFLAVINTYVDSLRRLDCDLEVTKDVDNPKYRLIFEKPELLDMSIYFYASKSNQHHGAPDRVGGLISDVTYDSFRKGLVIEFITRATARRADFKFVPIENVGTLNLTSDRVGRDTTSAESQPPVVDNTETSGGGKIKSSPRSMPPFRGAAMAPYRKQTFDQAHKNLMVKIKSFDYTSVNLLSALDRWKNQPAHRPLAYFTLFFQSINASRQQENISVVVSSTSKDHITFTTTMKTILPIRMFNASYLISAIDSAPLTQLKVTYNVEDNRFVCELKGDFYFL